MLMEPKTLLLKNGKKACLRSPLLQDAASMIHYLKQTGAETEFVLRYPEECTLSLKQEEQYLENLRSSDDQLMIVCTVEDELAGSAQIYFYPQLKMKHRARIAIGLIQKYWGLGIGTAMFEEMIDAAKKRGIRQLELDVIEGNTRAVALYKKMGFEQVAVKPNAILLKDGTMLDEWMMIKMLKDEKEKLSDS